MGDISRYVHHSSRRLSRIKRTISLPGSLDDDSKYFKCWNCGFTCDKDRDIVECGDKGTSGGVSTLFGHAGEEYLVDDNNEYIVEENRDEIIIAVGSYYPTMTKGCPLCGSTNYR